MLPQMSILERISSLHASFNGSKAELDVDEEASEEIESDCTIVLPNPHLNTISSDHLYHIGINVKDTKNTEDIVQVFGDLRFFVVGGTKERMYAFARLLRKLDLPGDEAKDEIYDIGAPAKRYAIYKVGRVLCCSHGMGLPSISILLHELLKLAKYSKLVDPIFIRVGTSGGVGVVPGTVIITNQVFNGLLRAEQEIDILGERIIRPTHFDKKLVRSIFRCANQKDNFITVMGNTMSTNCFYEGQCRLDGAICTYTAEERMAFLMKCNKEYNIKNIEMESLFAAITNMAGVRAANVCVAILNRLRGDQVLAPPEKLSQFERRPLIVVSRFIYCFLNREYPKPKPKSSDSENNAPYFDCPICDLIRTLK